MHYILQHLKALDHRSTDAPGIRSYACPAAPRSPNRNAYQERFFRSLKSECLDRKNFFGEDSLRRAVREYLAH